MQALLGNPTISDATATCPFCGSQQPGDYIKRCGHEGKIKTQMTTVVYQEEYGKEYRSPTQVEINAAEVSKETLGEIADEIPYGKPDEPMPGPETLGFRAPLYGFKKWSDLFTARQLFALMTFVKWTLSVRTEMKQHGYSSEWIEVVSAYLALLINKVADYNCTCARWQDNTEGINHLFDAARIPIVWDHVEANVIGESVSSYHSHRIMQSRVLSRLFDWPHIGDPLPHINCGDVLEARLPHNLELIVTDPPYYDAIPYADTSDFFFVWNKRNGFIPEILDSQTADSVVPKEKELIQHTARFGGAKDKAKAHYTLGMKKAFEKAHHALSDDALIVIVFAHKEPEAWETLLEAIIGSGFTVTASWPIDTERKQTEVRAVNSAALATSLWLVCRKRHHKCTERLLRQSHT